MAIENRCKNCRFFRRRHSSWDRTKYNDEYCYCSRYGKHWHYATETWSCKQPKPSET